jgi:acyl carrier protein
MVTQETDDLVFHKTCELLKPYNKKNIPLTTETNIATELEIDSVAVLDLIMEIEDIYGISIPMNLMAEIQTIGNLVQAIHDLGGKK